MDLESEASALADALDQPMNSVGREGAIALGRKNHLFAGSNGGAARWAVVASLLTTAKLNNVEPFAYLKDVLERMSNGHPMSRLDELLELGPILTTCQEWTLTASARSAASRSAQ